MLGNLDFNESQKIAGLKKLIGCYSGQKWAACEVKKIVTPSRLDYAHAGCWNKKKQFMKVKLESHPTVLTSKIYMYFLEGAMTTSVCLLVSRHDQHSI